MTQGARQAGARASTAMVVVLLGAIVAAPLAAVQQVPTAERRAGLTDTRWGAFVGCWEPVAGQEDADAGLLCVRPADLGVEMFTIQAGEIRTSDLLIADGEPRALQAEGCEGWEEVSFSDDGRRAFTRSAYSCEGVQQSGTGVLALVSPTQWVDVRAIEVDGERTSWVQRYRLVGVDRAVSEGVDDPGFGMETAARAARFVAHRGVGFGEVEEAARYIDTEALEGWLANRSEGFAPTAGDLEGLVDAGVAESVIDVIVAKSFPETFNVDAEGAAERAAAEAGAMPVRGARRTLYYGPRMPFGFRTMGYGYGYVPADAFYYGYGYGYPGYWGYRPGTVIIERRSAEPPGRIIRGQGYTRGTPSSGGSTAVPRSGTAGDRPAATPPRRPSADSPPPNRDDPPTRTARPRRPPPGG